MRYSISRNLTLATVLFAAGFFLLALMPQSASAAAVTLSNATSSSSNTASSTLAKAGNTVTFGLLLSGTPSATTTPVITLLRAGFTMASTSMSGSGTTWFFSTTSASVWLDGNVTFNFGWGGDAGEATTTFASAASTTFRHVVSDNTKPSISTMAATSSNSGSAVAMIGDVVTISFLASEGIATPSVTIGGHTAAVLGTTTPARFWTASTTVQSGDTSGALSFSVTPSDPAGNASTTAQTSVTSGSNVTVYASLPSITINGSNPDYVITSATETYSDAGASATDALSNSNSVVTTGSVDRTTAGSYTFTYTATDPAGNVNVATRQVIVAEDRHADGGSGSGGGNKKYPPSTPTPGAPVTTASLTAQLNALMLQLATLKGGAGGGQGASVGGQFVRDLQVGALGDDVRSLQMYLSSHGFPLASSGPGSPGSETMTFGGLTRAALAKFQAAHGITPSAGYFGPKTRAYVNANP